MKRVLHILDNLGYGGIQSFVMNVYRQIDRNQVQFDFLIHHHLKDNYEQEVEKLGGKIFCLPSRREGYIKNKTALRKFFEEHKEYEVVHMHESSLSYLEPLVAAKKAGVKKRIIHSHSTTQKGNPLHSVLHRTNQKKIYDIATDVFACSDKAAEWLIGEENFKAGKYKFIPNGIQPEKYYFSKVYRDMIRKEFSVSTDVHIYGLVGRLTWQKNHMFLLDVFKAITQIDTNSLLLIVGDGDLKEQIVEKAKELELFEKIVFTGNRNDTERIYSALDEFIMTSVNEGLPVTLVEAQASSLPCIVSENITKDVAISDFIRYVSLDEKPEVWAELCVKTLAEHTRIIEDKLFLSNPFNVEHVVNELCDFYTN